MPTHYISAASLDTDRTSAQLEFEGDMLTPSGRWVTTQTLTDTGASACFVSRKWVRQHKATPYSVSPIQLALADGHEVDRLKEAVDVVVRHGSHQHRVLCYVTDIGKYDIILGMNWLDHHRPTLTFGPQRSMRFSSTPCRLNCLQGGLPETIYSDQAPDSATRRQAPSGNIHLISARAACLMATRHPEQIVWVEPQH
jgi:hypothetical protein